MTLRFRLNPIDKKLPILHIINLANLRLELRLLSIKRQQRRQRVDLQALD